MEEIKLTSLSKASGCAAKIGPGMLQKVLKNIPKPTDKNLLVGSDTSDDGCVYKLSNDLAIVQTLDFFTPIVDDPYTFGAIAATNALKKQGLNWFDRFEYQALGALGIDPNLMLREGTNKIKANVDHTSAIQKAAFGVDDALDRIPIVAALKREIANGNIQDPEGTKLKAFKEKVAGALDRNSGKLSKSEYASFLDPHDMKKLGINRKPDVDLALKSYAQDYFTQKEYLGLQLELAKKDTRAIDYIRNDSTLESVNDLYGMTASRNSTYKEVQDIKTATFDATKELNKAWERANQELNIADRKRKSS